MKRLLFLLALAACSPVADVSEEPVPAPDPIYKLSGLDGLERILEPCQRLYNLDPRNAEYRDMYRKKSQAHLTYGLELAAEAKELGLHSRRDEVIRRLLVFYVDDPHARETIEAATAPLEARPGG